MRLLKVQMELVIKKALNSKVHFVLVACFSGFVRPRVFIFLPQQLFLLLQVLLTYPGKKEQVLGPKKMPFVRIYVPARHICS